MTVSKADLKGKSCVYCGIRPATTRDHVIPKCLFLHPYPDNIHLVVAPACAYCNGAKSKDDEFLRDTLIVDAQCGASSVAHALVTGRMSRATNRNRSVIGRAILHQSWIQPIYSKGGIYMGDAPVIRNDSKRMGNTLRRIVKGLFLCRSDRYLPADHTVEVYDTDPQYRLKTWDDMRQSNGVTVTIGDEVFSCVVRDCIEYPSYTVWALLFYNGRLFIAETVPPELQGQPRLEVM